MIPFSTALDNHTFTPGTCNFVNVSVNGSLPIVEGEYTFNCNKTSMALWTCACSPIVMTFSPLAYNNYTLTYQEFVYKEIGSASVVVPVIAHHGSWWMTIGRFLNKTNTTIVVQPPVGNGGEPGINIVNNTRDLNNTNQTLNNTNHPPVVPPKNYDTLLIVIDALLFVILLLLLVYKNKKGKTDETEKQKDS